MKIGFILNGFLALVIMVYALSVGSNWGVTLNGLVAIISFSFGGTQ